MILPDYFSVKDHREWIIEVQISLAIRAPLKRIRCPRIDLPSNFRNNRPVSGREICIKHSILWRAAIIWRAKNDHLRTLSVLTSPSLEEFPVLALLDSARVVLGSSKVPFEFWGAHPELRSETRFGDESIENLRLEV